MDRIDLLRIFVRVVESASFTKAAETLGMPRSSVSTAVHDLETRVGARLLHRTTRHVAPTQDGNAFFARCQRLIADYEETEGLFRQSSPRPRGKLRINVPGRFGRLIIAPALPGFFALYPEVEIELGVTDRTVDLVQDGVDCAIRVGPLMDSSLVARKIGDLVLINCASPRYLAAHGTPRNIEELRRHLAVNYLSPASGRIDEWEWVENGKIHSLPLPSQVTVNNADAMIACCLAGLGLIQIPAYDVAVHLATGELVEVMPDHCAPPLPMTILYPHRHHVSRRLQVFIEWVTTLLLARIPAEAVSPHQEEHNAPPNR
ncbi:LysR family transcriptional regulator [Beijerinckia indica]|uniref:Transcriptional regulator, LysR family n=1 Tax=Beijerinckia indica subsp. indica (strain ATCC 9039 / DSM 1715 / NCIMB 8712) TaxID=395963 RepID=B2IK15_BEII9|nr:LysR family transcriptional regulator [Beijerinckia indica]ACB96387.1 transcriptional regulator, LysR family [Beijerinckia indica subsp. indica ATCC 9039]